jgi:hypothetical protein
MARSKQTTRNGASASASVSAHPSSPIERSSAEEESQGGMEEVFWGRSTFNATDHRKLKRQGCFLIKSPSFFPPMKSCLFIRTAGGSFFLLIFNTVSRFLSTTFYVAFYFITVSSFIILPLTLFSTFLFS